MSRTEYFLRMPISTLAAPGFGILHRNISLHCLPLDTDFVLLYLIQGTTFKILTMFCERKTIISSQHHQIL